MLPYLHNTDPSTLASQYLNPRKSGLKKNSVLVAAGGQSGGRVTNHAHRGNTFLHKTSSLDVLDTEECYNKDRACGEGLEDD